MPTVSYSKPGSRIREVHFEGRLTLGRDESNGLALPDPTVSRFHAVITPSSEGGWCIEDLGSMNGTWIEDSRIQRTTLEDRTRFALGSVRLHFTAPPEAATDDDGEPTWELRLQRGPTGTQARQSQGTGLATACRMANVLHEATNLTELYSRTVELVEEATGAERVLIAIHDPQGGRTAVHYAHPPRLAGELRPSSTVIKQVMQLQQALVIPDVALRRDLMTAPSLTGQDIRSVLCVPLVGKTRTLGVLFATHTTERHFEPVEQRLMTAIGLEVGLAIEYHALERRLADQTLNTMRALVRGLELRDSYTAGHSRRVAAMVEVIAKHMGFEEAFCVRLEIAAALHDIGKLGMDDSILRTPRRLTHEELALVRTHSQRGAEALEPLTDMAWEREIVLHHHERWDGTGYPAGLAGNEIPQGSRIVAVADTLDAIASERPYRPAKPLEDAMEMARKVSGTQLDPEVVEAAGQQFDRLKRTVTPTD